MGMSTRDFITVGLALARARDHAVRAAPPECSDAVDKSFAVVRDFLAAYFARIYPRFDANRFWR